MYYITCDIKNNPDNKSLLKCFTNTYNTFQGKYETTDTDGNKKYKTTFNYFYTLNSTNLDQSPGNTSEADKLSDVIAQTNGVAPIVGYSVYAYDKESNTTTFEYTDQDTAVGSDKLIHYQTTITTKEGANIDNTSLYVQVKFQIKTIPGVWGMSFTPKAVTVSRLISIEPNE
jgi:hypothetical protein